MKGFIVASTWPNKFFVKWRYRLSFFLPKEKSQKSYIIPNKFGMMFGLLCLVLLYTSFATGNNLLYLYTFFLTGIGFSSLWFTHANVADLKIIEAETEDVFAGEDAYTLVTVFNPGRQPRYHVQVYNKKLEVGLIDEIPPFSSRSVRVNLGRFPRGRQVLPRLTVSSSFPFLLLTTWKNFELEKSFSIFPKRSGHSNFPPAGLLKENAEGRRVDQVRSAESEFSGHRKFESSDSPRHIDWKAYARTEKMLVKDYQGFRPLEIKIQWRHTGHLGHFEDRLSQMALWIEIAEMKGLHYSFEFGSLAVMTGRGRNHYLLCLKHLAEAEDGVT
jgi:uncharacterized protein (DUF58 family)